VASTRDGSLLTASRVRAPGGAEGLFAAVDSLTASLRGGLRQAGLAVTDRAVDVATLTTRNPAAYRAYIRGMEELNRLRLEEARRAFRSAIAADSLFALARYYAAIAEWWANDFDAAQEEVTRALALGKSLSGREREGLRGIDALIHWDFERAAAIYRELLARYPDDKEFLYGLGEAAFHSERYDEAEPVLQRAVALDPTFGVAYYHLVDIAVERRDLPGALAQVAAYGRIDPAGPEALRLEANARGLLGDTDGAIAALNRLVERDPEDGSALFQLAVTHAWRGEFREAEESTARLRRVSPEESIRGADEAELMLLWAKGRPREMERLAAARIAEADRSATFYRIMLTYHRIRALVALKRYPEALQTARDVRGAIESLIPARNPTLPMTVQILLYMRRFDEAEKLLTEYGRSLERGAIQRERQARDHVAGLIALAKGRYREAVPLLRRGKPAGPAASRLWLHRWALARACLKAGEREQGLDLLRDMVKSGEYITLPEDVFAAHLLLARTLEEQGKRAEALALYRRVERQYREAEPDLPELQEARAGARRLQGSAAGAS
jgi:tetratricopeptide (TPR) repeat protein